MNIIQPTPPEVEEHVAIQELKEAIVIDLDTGTVLNTNLVLVENAQLKAAGIDPEDVTSSDSMAHHVGTVYGRPLRTTAS